MAIAPYNGEALIESVRNMGMIPDAGTLGGNDSDLLRHLNEEMDLYLIPLLVGVRQEYLVNTTRITLSGTTLKYRLPARAAGDALRVVRYVDSNGNMEDEPLPEIIPERQGDYTWSSTSRPSGWYLEGNYICLVGSNVSGSLEISWHFRPGEIVKSTDAREITAVDLVAKTVDSATAFPTTWSTSKKFDVHSPKSGAEIKVYDEPITTITSSSPFRITFSGAIDGSVRGTKAIEVGDWICLQGEAVYPALPVELHPLLAKAGNVAVQEALGKREAVEMHRTLLKDAERSVMKLLSPRTVGRARRILGREGLLWRQC